MAYISLRVLSIYTFIQALLSLSQIINLTIFSNLAAFKNSSNMILSLILGSITPFIFLLAMSIFLWIFTDRISNHLIPKQENNEHDSKLDLDNLQYIAFSVVGILFIIFTIPQIFSLLSSIIKMKEITFDLATTQFKTELIFSAVESGVRLLIGFVLIFGSKGLSGLLRRIREAG